MNAHEDRRAVNDVKTSRVRFCTLDGYRFIAASLVVLHHFNADFELHIDAVTPAADGLIVMVDFFFILSGFVITSTYHESVAKLSDYGRFLRRRLARIYPLHLATLAVFVGLAIGAKMGFLHPNHPDGLELSGVPATVLLVNAWGELNTLTFNGPAWSISAEWLAYLAFPILLFLSRRVSLAGNIGIVIGFTAIMIGLRHYHGLRPWTESTFDYGAFRALPTFFLGMLLAERVGRAPKRFALPWPAVHAIFVVSLITLNFQEIPREVTIALLALLVACAGAAELSRGPSILSGRFMSRMGDASYALYMIHAILYVPVLFVLRKHGLLGTPVALAAAIATYVFAVGMSVAVYTWFEHPLRRMLSGDYRREKTGSHALPSFAWPRFLTANRSLLAGNLSKLSDLRIDPRQFSQDLPPSRPGGPPAIAVGR